MTKHRWRWTDDVRRCTACGWTRAEWQRRYRQALRTSCRPKVAAA